MNKQECAKVLAKIQLIDNRQVDALTLEEWFDTIGHLKYEVAIGAVRLHRQESTDWLLPAHIVKNASRVREEQRRLARLARAHGLVSSDWDVDSPIPDDIKEELNDIRERGRRALEDSGVNYGYMG